MVEIYREDYGNEIHKKRYKLQWVHCVLEDVCCTFDLSGLEKCGKGFPRSDTRSNCSMIVVHAFDTHTFCAHVMKDLDVTNDLLPYLDDDIWSSLFSASVVSVNRVQKKKTLFIAVVRLHSPRYTFFVGRYDWAYLGQSRRFDWSLWIVWNLRCALPELPLRLLVLYRMELWGRCLSS